MNILHRHYFFRVIAGIISVIFFATVVFPGDPTINKLDPSDISLETPNNKSPLKTLRIKGDLVHSKNQRELLESGFMTYASLEVYILKLPNNLNPSIKLINDTDNRIALSRSVCIVKYDTWNEKYQIQKLTEPTDSLSSKNIQKFIQTCLHTSAPLKPVDSDSGFSNYVVLFHSVEQLDAEQSRNIKNWFVKQQNTMLQGIFAHMIGEVKLAEVSYAWYPLPKL